MQFVDNDQLPKTCCKSCLTDIEKSVTLKSKISNNQKFLLECVLQVKKDPEFIEFENVKLDPQIFEIKQEIVSNANIIEEKLPDFIDSFNEEDSDGSSAPKSDPNDKDFEEEPTTNNKTKSKTKEKKKFQCKFCKKFLCDRARLERHRKRFHPQNEAETKIFIEKKERSKDNVGDSVQHVLTVARQSQNIG